MGNVKAILAALKKVYPKADCALHHQNPWQLLTATILSAQCTDARVNMVTPVLFKKYPTPQHLAKAKQADAEKIIHSTGFFRSKAKSLIGSSRALVEKYGGRVPKSMADLLALRGVARETANVVLGTAYGIAEGVVVDTHVMRLSGRLGFSKKAEPVKIEQDLMKIIPQKNWIWFSHALVSHGRRFCMAKNPNCEECPLRAPCPWPGKK